MKTAADNRDGKKLTILRVVLFTVITYVLNFVLLAYMKKTDRLTSAVMFTPLTGAVLTMLITREKTHSPDELMLPLKLKGQARYYVYALAGGLLFSIFGGLLCAVYFSNEFSLAEQMTSAQALDTFKKIPYYGCLSVYLVFICFGEEYGWRAYLTPRLEKIMPSWAAMIVQGVIWAMWHKPLLDEGWNFGKDAPFFPWLNYAAMILMCIFIGTCLTWLVKKTGSVMPAALGHSAIDMFGRVLGAFVPDEIVEGRGFETGVLALIPIPMIIAIICIIDLSNNHNILQPISSSP